MPECGGLKREASVTELMMSYLKYLHGHGIWLNSKEYLKST